MNGAAEPRTIKFDLPYDVGGESTIGPSGLQVSVSGGLMPVSGSDAIRQSIMILLSTRPGERVMRPEYGCPLHRLAFEPNDAATAGLAIHYVRTALNRWEPRIEIISLVAEPDAEISAAHGRLVVRLEYRIRATSEFAALQFDLNLSRPEYDAV